MKKFKIVFIVFILGVLLSPKILYCWGIFNLESELVYSNVKLTIEQEKELWLDLKEIGSPNLKKISPYGYILYFYCISQEGLNSVKCSSKYSGIRASSLAIKKQLSSQFYNQGNTVWQITWLASTIWVTNNWDIHQVLSTYYESSNNN